MLYEVITYSELGDSYVTRIQGMIKTNKRYWQAGSAAKKAKSTRITSYNVCYTKLLRL